MAMTEKLYRKVATEDPTGRWEFNYGHLRSKPAMTNAHLLVSDLLVDAILDRIDRQEYSVRTDSPRLRTSSGNYYLPDVCVFPRRILQQAFRAGPRRFQVFDEPMPFVAEVWSPNTGDYDVATKVPECQRRGDADIWLLHPYEKTVRRWIRQADSGYEETILRSGSVQLSALPNVTIDIESLFGSDTGDDDGDH